MVIYSSGQDFFFQLKSIDRYYAPPFSRGGGVSITAVCTYIRLSIRPIGNTFGFHAISFERIGVLD